MIRYWLDRDDRIVRVSEEWRTFARANQGEHLASDELLGQPLWAHISGALVRQAYEGLMRRARESGSTVEIPYRCDAPDLRRYMTLRLTPESDGGITVETWVDRTEKREPVIVSYELDGSGEDAITMCSWCKQVKVEEGWAELEYALEELDIMGEGGARPVSHGICEACSEMLDAEEV